MPFLSATAQRNQHAFDFKLAAGLNFAELEGEGRFDYFGLNAGLMTSTRMSKHWRFGVELLYSGNGEYILPHYYPDIEYGTIRLHHVEVPLNFDFGMGILEREKYYDLHLQFGLAYVQLFGYRAFDRGGEEVTDQFVYRAKGNYLLQTGSLYQFSPRSSVHFRGSIPLMAGLEPTVTVRYIYRLSTTG